MQALDTLTGSEHELVLEREKAERDLEIQRLRKESRTIEGWLDPKRVARQREEMTRANLAPTQTVVMPPLRLGGN